MGEMIDPDRRPTAQEIEELIDLVRRDPASPAFIDLGEAYLALGRPRDAVQIATMGLGNSPDNLEARVLLARAHAALHQWKEAQGELLRVVKVDRSNRQGFALLGEVLLRRADFERAVPVLQHAQNLDPTSPQILSMLKRARNGQPLDAPAPVPQPMPPRGETNQQLEIERSPARSRPGPSQPPPSQPPRRPGPSQPPPIQASMPMRPDATDPSPPPAMPYPYPPPQAPGYPPPQQAYAQQPQGYPPQAPIVAPPADVPPPPRANKPTAPPPMSVEGVRPRIVSGAKPQNAAAASLRQSAAVGESYLNELLTGGLLDVAGVRVPDMEFDLRPDRRWGRSTRRAFIFLFVVLVLGIGGGGTGYWWNEKQKAEAILALQKEAKAAIGTADLPGLESERAKLGDANKRDNTNSLTQAYVLENAGLEALLYGKPPDGMDLLYAGLLKEIQPTDPGARELVIGRVALVLSRIGVGVQVKGTEDPNFNKEARETLVATTKLIDDYLAQNDGDKWARWLKARTQLVAGERKAAKATLKKAADGEDGLVLAMIDQADMLAEDGAIDDSVALYDKALKKAPGHTLAVLGKALARAEAGLDPGPVIDDINVGLGDKDLGNRVNAYRALALGFAELGIEDYPKATEQIKLALAIATLADPRAAEGKPPMPMIEPRFWAGLAWAEYVRGDIKAASEAGKQITHYGKSKAEEDPAVTVVDAGFALASGRPDLALDLVTKLEIQGPRARTIKTYALLDLGKDREALGEADELVKLTTPKSEGGKASIEARILQAEAKLVASSEKEREEAAKPLESLTHQANSKLARHALGMAWMMLGNFKEAESQLGLALAEVDESKPNPLAYRTHTALADILIGEGNIDEAQKHLDEALKINSGYIPALETQARIYLRKGDPDKAADLLDPILKDKDKGSITPAVQLTQAEVLATRKGATAADKDKAAAILADIKDKVQPPTEIGRVAALIDPKLPEKLGVPVPTDAKAPPPVAPPHHHH